MRHASSFGIANAKDFLHQIVIPQYEEFLESNSSPRHALLAMMVAYHMYEWVHPSKFTKEDFEARYPDSKKLASVFELARKMTNGTKHFNLQVETRRQRGFSSGFSEGFARPLVMTLSDGSEMSADLLLQQLVEFWIEQDTAGAL